MSGTSASSSGQRSRSSGSSTHVPPLQAAVQGIGPVQANPVPGASQANPPQTPQTPQIQPNPTPGSKPNSTAGSAQPAEWLSKWLTWWSLTLFCFLDGAIVVVILTLIQVSANKNGIATVPRPSKDVDSLSISSLWQFGLLWTSLPSLLLSLFALMWNGIVAAAADRQPFIELRRLESRAANAKVTVMLDYRTRSGFTRWFHAFRNGHVILGSAMIISLVMTVVAVPLASHILTSVDSQHQSIVPVNYLTSFADRSNLINGNLLPAIDLATAILGFGGSPPAWMTSQRAFVGFSSVNASLTGNLTAFTSAYSAHLDCQILNSTTYESFSNTSSLIINDRGCNFQKILSHSSDIPYYISIWYNPCDGPYNRIGLFSGVYSTDSTDSPLNLSNFSAISCIPSYTRETGMLKVPIAPQSLPGPPTFTSNLSVEDHPQLITLLEPLLPAFALFEPSSQFESNAAGFAVYQIATTRDPSSPLSSSLLKDCLEQFYSTFYAGLVINNFIKPDAGAGSGTANLSVQVTRLYIITATSYALCGFLIILGICAAALCIYTIRHGSILCEEPVGLLGVGAIMHNSGVSSFLTDFRQKHPTESKAYDFVKSKYTTEKSKCYYLPNQPALGNTSLRDKTVPPGRIEVDDLKPKP